MNTSFAVLIVLVSNDSHNTGTKGTKIAVNFEGSLMCEVLVIMEVGFEGSLTCEVLAIMEEGVYLCILDIREPTFNFIISGTKMLGC